MTNENNTQFISFMSAIMAMQCVSMYFALEGYHVSISIHKETKSVECTAFHDANVHLLLPEGYLYSSVQSNSNQGAYWTSFFFNF